MTHFSVWLKIGTVISVFLLGGCASQAFQNDVPRQAFVAPGSDNFARHMPIIVSEYPSSSYNRIGQPEAVREDGQIRLWINTDVPVAYTEKRHFETAKGKYTNLIYRIHFEKVPFSLLPFNLTTGKNVGLLFIVTLNEKQQPILITSVHTCGCYLAIVPTNYLQRDAYPDNWNTESQRVYGATLPGLLKFDDVDDDEKFVIYLHDKTHRVIHLDIATIDDLVGLYGVHQLAIKPIDKLDSLMLSDGGKQVSMFESSGSRKDYVRDSRKPFEFLLMSWWAMDIRVGVDKRYGKAGHEGQVFYTSLKPWAQKESDMRDFPSFLGFWDWRL